jgi:dimethylaniline monooxygenase (N-oxide forming) / hypotaurine monooxygenase
VLRFAGDNKVELTDGTILEVDAVILCTGYESDFSLTPEFSPVEPGDGSRVGINKAALARLYMNLFPPRYADTLVYTSYCAQAGVLPVIDLTAMAIAHIWKGTSPSPLSLLWMPRSTNSINGSETW